MLLLLTHMYKSMVYFNSKNYVKLVLHTDVLSECGENLTVAAERAMGRVFY